MILDPKSPPPSRPCRVRPVRSRADLRRFGQLPQKLLGASAVAVQPLKMQQDAVLDRKRHPFYDQGRGASAEFFLADDGQAGQRGQPVGRIAAIIDNRQNTEAAQRDPGHELCGHFGFFDCVDSPAVARELIATAADWLRARGVKRMFGPASPSQSYDYGLLVAGHDCPHRFMLPYNPAYYAALLEGCGLTKAKDLVSLSADLQDPQIRKPIDRFLVRADAMRARCTANITIRSINMQRFRQEAETCRTVLNDVLSNHFGHSPIAQREWRLITDSLRPFLNPDFVLLAERDGQGIGVTIAVPDLNEVIRRLRVRVGLLEPLEFLVRAVRSRPECIRVVVVGVTRAGGNFAVAPMMVGQLVRNLLANGVRYVDAHQVLEDNCRILHPLLNHGFLADRRYRVYEMAL